MSCYHPLKAFRTPHGVVFSELRRHGDILGPVELPCGQCIGCRMRRASDWELRVMHEAQMHSQTCFVTLTYAPGNLPADGSLCHRDFQLFMKRLRNARGAVRFYMCGEYGDVTQRPHYHACLFGVNFFDRVSAGKSGSGAAMFTSEELTRLWGLGRAVVQDLVRETASYCARYIMKKALGKSSEEVYSRVLADGSTCSVAPEYAAMSLKPGIGAYWFDRFGSDVFPRDYVVAGGTKRQVPRYYDKLAEKRLAVGKLALIENARLDRALAAAPDQSPERRIVREAVHTARVSTLKRSLK